MRSTLPRAAALFLPAALGFALLASLPATLRAQSPHPLDPPSWQEYWTVLEVLREEGRLTDSTTFSLVLLHPGDKAAVWAWQPGDPVTRALEVVTRTGPVTSEAVVDVGERRLVSWTEIPGAHAPWLDGEFGAMEETVKAHAEVLAALERRGITDLFFVQCGGGPPGRFGLEEEDGRRLAHVHCRDVRRVRNTWTRGIEGLIVVYDMDADSVLRVIDEGVVPVPETVADYDPAAVGAPMPNTHPLRVDRPAGPGYSLDGHQVEWDAWRFHVRPDQRVGPVISLVRWVGEDGTSRPILYEGSLSEIFVPYMDPSVGWYPRNFLDAGEYTAGGLIKPLARAIDCPANADYLGMVVVGDDGRPRDVPDVICVFERYSGDVLWRHLAATHEGRPKRDLVVRAAAVLGNYDYVFDWTFQQDGTIRVSVGATGIAEVKAVTPRDARAVVAAGTNGSNGSNGSNGDHASAEARADAYGRFVDEHIVAVNHDHYFSYRLDLDVDGPANTVHRDGLRTMRLPDDHPRRSIWVVDSRPLSTESEAKLDVDLRRPALWRVLSGSRSNDHGYPTSYQLNPGKPIVTLLAEDDWPRLRAGFIDHHLWVTPYQPEERYAAGRFPTLSEPGEGLPRWTAADRPIADADVVVWYTAGMHHVVRAEDWPVMPTAVHSFELRPFDFFSGNPALRAPVRP
jgi:primary-amine oxidase